MSLLSRANSWLTTSNPTVGDTIVVSYKNKEGVLSPDDITIEGYEKVVKDDVVLCELTKAGKQKISAGE